MRLLLGKCMNITFLFVVLFETQLCPNFNSAVEKNNNIAGAMNKKFDTKPCRRKTQSLN